MFTDNVASPDEYRIYFLGWKKQNFVTVKGIYVSVYAVFSLLCETVVWGEGECTAHIPLTKANMEYVKHFSHFFFMLTTVYTVIIIMRCCYKLIRNEMKKIWLPEIYIAG